MVTAIVSQTFLTPHLANDTAMPGLALPERDIPEIIGQIIRLALAPLGAPSDSAAHVAFGWNQANSCA